MKRVVRRRMPRRKCASSSMVAGGRSEVAGEPNAPTPRVELLVRQNVPTAEGA